MKSTPRFMTALVLLLATAAWSAPLCHAQDVLLDAQIRLSQARLQQLGAQFQQVDADTEDHVRQALELLLPLKDSLESHDKVANQKRKVIEDLNGILNFYASERSKREAELARSPGSPARGQLVKEIVALDGRISERAAEIIKLTASLAEDPNVQQYRTYYAQNTAGWVFPVQQISPEYDQNRVVSMVSQALHEKVMNALKQSVQSRQERARRLEAMKTYLNDPKWKAELDELIKENQKVIEDRKRQMVEVAVPAAPTAQQPVGKRQFPYIASLIDDHLQQMQQNHRQLVALKAQMGAERQRLEQLQAQKTLEPRTPAKK
ncbi:MAG: hypothetical protein FJ388_04615 [Verrucomicrobia bacterium]|nr:hypothetical protein [Verrucomicrobiota bacterium]